jgi:hypothetical protein
MLALADKTAFTSAHAASMKLNRVDERQWVLMSLNALNPSSELHSISLLFGDDNFTNF